MGFVWFVLLALYFVYNIIQVAHDQKAGLPFSYQVKDLLFGLPIDIYYFVKSRF
jgi:hypothetical protein